MASLVQTGAPWWQRRLVRAARSRLLPFLILAAALCLAWSNDRVPLAWQVLLAGLGLATGAFLLRRDWLPLFGPVFFYDLARSGRRGQPAAHRCLYGALLLLLLFWAYASWFPYHRPSDWLESPHLTVRDRAAFAEAFFVRFLTLQYLVVVLLTPAYVAGAIADAKERRTLEFLLVTDLSDREIVLGMLAARLVKLFLLLLTGLPILGLLSLLGGVDPNLVLTGFVTTAVLTVSLGSLSILMSVLLRTVLGAVAATYAVMLLLLLVPGFPWPFANPLASTLALHPVGTTGGARVLPLLDLLDFAAVHGVITLTCSWAAVRQLRPGLGATSPSESGTEAAVHPRRAPLSDLLGNEGEAWGQGWGPYLNREGPDSLLARRPVGQDALLWKEIHAERHLAVKVWGLLSSTARGAVVLLLFAVLGLVNTCPGSAAGLLEGGLGAAIQPLVRSLSIGLGCFLLLLIALSAAGRISRERERRTLDSLLALPVPRGAILFAKWLGSILCVRGLWWALGLVWGIGVLTGGLSIIALPLLAAALLVYAAFMASLGLWFSASSQTTLRATLLTLATFVFIAGPSLVPMGMASESGFRVWQAALALYGLTPVAALSLFSFRTTNLLEPATNEDMFLHIMVVVAALHLYLAAAAALWLLTLARLRAEKGPRPRPGIR